MSNTEQIRHTACARLETKTRTRTNQNTKLRAGTNVQRSEHKSKHKRKEHVNHSTTKWASDNMWLWEKGMYGVQTVQQGPSFWRGWRRDVSSLSFCSVFSPVGTDADSSPSRHLIHWSLRQLWYKCTVISLLWHMAKIQETEPYKPHSTLSKACSQPSGEGFWSQK